MGVVFVEMATEMLVDAGAKVRPYARHILVPGSSDRDIDAASVVGRALALHEPGLFHLVDQAGETTSREQRACSSSLIRIRWSGDWRSLVAVQRSERFVEGSIEGALDSGLSSRLRSPVSFVGIRRKLRGATEIPRVGLAWPTPLSPVQVARLLAALRQTSRVSFPKATVLNTSLVAEVDGLAESG